LLVVTLIYAGRTDEVARYLKAAEAAILGREDADYLRCWVQSTWAMAQLSADDEEEANRAHRGLQLQNGSPLRHPPRCRIRGYRVKAACSPTVLST
jgi:hypothetical protein